MKSYLFTLALALLAANSHTQAQTTEPQDTVYTGARGHLWGLAYGDFAYKVKGDTLNRGGTNQYTGIRQNESQFQLRRIYLGYDYRISKTFSSEFLLAMEDGFTSTNTTPVITSGDLLQNGRMAMFVKLANVKWHNIFKGADLSLGEVYTPAAVLLPEVVWDYRCIERTVSELRRTPAWDMGLSLNGKIINRKDVELGYNVMVGNGTASRPESNGFKMFYGDVYTKLLNKRLILDAYADYTKIDWTPTWHHDRSMIKFLAAYTTPKFTVGVEGFMINLMNDNIAHVRASGSGTGVPSYTDTITTKSTAISIFARGRIYKDQLGFFARFDMYDPSMNNNNVVYDSYTPTTPNYNPNTREQFITAGIDYSPISKIHIMPNLWFNSYNNAGPLYRYNAYDMVFRVSIYYVYGK